MEVDLVGRAVFGNRHLQLTPKPRVPGTPVVRVEIDVWFSALMVRSAGLNFTDFTNW